MMTKMLVVGIDALQRGAKQGNGTIGFVLTKGAMDLECVSRAVDERTMTVVTQPVMAGGG